MEAAKLEVKEESAAVSPQSPEVRQNIFKDVDQSPESEASERMKKESEEKEPHTPEKAEPEEGEQQAALDEVDNGGSDPAVQEQSTLKLGNVSPEKHSGSKQETPSSKSTTGPQKHINFNVVQKIC